MPLSFTPSSSPQRAFALPLVLLIALVSGLAIVVLLQRHSLAQLTVARQVDVYTGHHWNAGIKECIRAWMNTANRAGIQGNLEPDGLAFRMEMADHQIAVYFRDGQGTVVSATDSLAGEQREIVEVMLKYLEQLPPETRENTTRPAGPAQISLSTAPLPVLEALAYAVVGPDRMREVVDSLSRERSQEEETAVAQIGRALQGLGLTEQESLELQSMLAAQPTLWEVVVDEHDATGQLVRRAGGLMDVPAEESTSDPFNQLGPFLTWEELPLDKGRFDR